ncbi:putative Had-superfamily subfamily variant 1 [Seiridium unicorne]|uniref:Had-superfamily subfamily variant 1 n=1 Tax=Seiridium unicorne TaxID=138068 RepID=A0ABR2V966_9PEZI
MSTTITPDMSEQANPLSIKSELLSKIWMWFDLDDTVHEFRRASGAATSEALGLIARRYDLELGDLERKYAEVGEILSVLSAFALPGDEIEQDVLDVYEKKLGESLRLKGIVLDALKELKALGKEIVIVSEGPQDSQERTVIQLGISSYVDFLCTSNFFGVSKTDGLFRAALVRLKVEACDVAYVGDSEARDIVPARREGIYCIHLNEARGSRLTAQPQIIHRLSDLQSALSTIPEPLL